MSQESKTPRTDANAWKDGSMRVVSADFARQLERELAAVTAERDALVASMGWRPIETAPKDGTLIILGGGEFQRPVFAWWTSRGCWAGDLRGPYEAIPYKATHWMPLPAPPTAEPER